MSGPEPKAGILEIAPYVAGKANAAGFAAPIKLSANENALGCSVDARAAYIAGAQAIHRYPDPGASALREAIAAAHDLDPGRIVFGQGSDELFSLVAQAYLSPGDTMVQPQFAFAAWAIAARAAGAIVRSAPERDYSIDVDALIKAVDETTRVVFVANPANPTGTVVPFREIERLHAGLPENVVLVLDAAYAEFAEDLPDYEDGMRLARTAPNVVLTRTFSKLHGLASLRLGWGYAAAPVIDVLNRIRLPFNTSAGAQAAGIAALKDRAFIAQSLALVEEWRPKLARMLCKAGLVPLPTAANFVTAIAASAEVARRIEQDLAAHGILVRSLANYGMSDALRVTVGAPNQMQALERVLEAVRPHKAAL